MKLDINTDEQTILLAALDKELASSKRAQTTAKQPQIREVYNTYQRTVETLMARVDTLKEPLPTK